MIRVLVADDDPRIRELLSEVVSRDAGYLLVGAVGHADEAIALAAAERPDVALVDVSMPGSGLLATRGIRRRSPETKILALSAHEDRSTVISMLEAGAVGYIVKGESMDGLLDSIARAAAGHGSLSGEVTREVIDELVEQLTTRRRAQDREHAISARVREVVAARRGVEIAFQAICALGDGTPVGSEALSRFRGSAISPERWFAEAHEVGLGVELELRAAESALRQASSVPPAHYVTLNASPATVTDRAFEELLGAHEPHRLIVEITERAPVDDYDRLNTALRRLRAGGVRVAIDDAGAGFASLRHILQIEPEMIKLDRTLIAGIERERAQRALAAGLISFAEKMGCAIVAEGIEREAQRDILCSLGVEYGQGFFLARPGPLPLAPGG